MINSEEQPENPLWMEGKIIGETAKCLFSDLMQPFAQGRLVEVSSALDLVEVTQALNNDQSDLFSAWVAAGQINRLDDLRAKSWVQDDVLLWTVVLAPWVLVQLTTD